MPKAKLPLIIAIIVAVVLIVLAVIFGGVKKGAPEKGISLKEADIAEEIYGFSAEIKEIKDNALTLEAWILMADAEEKPIKGIVKALVTDNTKIVKLKFPTNIPEGSEEPIFPEETQVSFGDLKAGDKIDVGTDENVSENIKNETEFALVFP